jgi:hypothetical protein
MSDESILEEAARVVSGDRAEAYGEPGDHFARVGRAWAAILEAHFGLPVDDLPPRIVGLMMIAFKVDREANQARRDNLVDIAGYAECVSAIVGGRRAS